MYTHPGSKLLFQGGEFGQSEEWNFEESLDWHLLEHGYHQGVQKLVADVNELYRKEPALYEKQFEANGFEWIDYNDAENSVLVFLRKGNEPENDLLLVFNMTPIPRQEYRIGLPRKGTYQLIFNSDDPTYSGSGFEIQKQFYSEELPWQFRDYSAQIDLPPLAAMGFKMIKKKETI